MKKPLPDVISPADFETYKAIAGLIAEHNVNCGAIPGICALLIADVVHSSGGHLSADETIAATREVVELLLKLAPVGSFNPETGQPAAIH